MGGIKECLRECRIKRRKKAKRGTKKKRSMHACMANGKRINKD
jgi:hypothetical protein